MVPNHGFFLIHQPGPRSQPRLTTVAPWMWTAGRPKRRLDALLVGNSTRRSGKAWAKRPRCRVGLSRGGERSGEIELLVGGWGWTPLKNMKVNWDDDIPNIWENKKCSKPPTRLWRTELRLSWNEGTNKNGRFLVETRTEMDDDWGCFPMTQETTNWVWGDWQLGCNFRYSWVLLGVNWGYKWFQVSFSWFLWDLWLQIIQLRPNQLDWATKPRQLNW